MHIAQKIRLILIAPAIIAIFILAGCFKKEAPEITQQQEDSQTAAIDQAQEATDIEEAEE